jgi:hypothetical protein
MDREFSSRVIEALEDLNPPDGLENAIELQQRDSALEASESHKAILRTLAERRNEPCAVTSPLVARVQPLAEKGRHQ